MKVYLFLQKYKKIIMAIVLCIYFIIELIFILKDYFSLNLNLQNGSSSINIAMISLISFIIFLNLCLKMLVLMKKYFIISNYILVLICILMNEYEMQLKKCGVFTNSLQIVLIIHSYQQLIILKCKKLPQVFILHMLYFLTRQFLHKETDHILKLIQLPLFFMIITISITFPFDNKMFVDDQQTNHLFDIECHQQVTKSNFPPDYYQINNQSYLISTQQKEVTNKDGGMKYIYNSNAKDKEQQNSENYSKQQTPNPIQKINLCQRQNIQQQEYAKDLDILSSGVLIISQTKSILKCNEQSYHYFQYLGINQPSPSTQCSIHQQILIPDLVFNAELQYIKKIHKKNNSPSNKILEQINHEDRNILQKEVEQLSQIKEKNENSNDSSCKRNNSTDTESINLDKLNKLKDVIIEEKQNDTQINHLEECMKHQQLLNHFQNNTLFIESTSQNDQTFLNTSHQIMNSSHEKQETKQFVYHTEQHKDRDDTFDKKQDSQKQNFIKCKVPSNLYQFFSECKQNITIGSLLDFLLDQKPVRNKKNKVNIDEDDQDGDGEDEEEEKNINENIIEQQTEQSQDAKSNHNQSQLSFKEINQTEQQFKQNFDNGKYKYFIQNDYIIITLMRQDTEGKRKIIDVKIGCFLVENDNQNEQIHISNNSKDNIQKKQFRTGKNDFSDLMNNMQNIDNLRNKQKKNKKDFEIRDNHHDQLHTNSEVINYQDKKQNSNKTDHDQNLNLKTYIFSIEIQEASPSFLSLIKTNIDNFKKKILCSISHELRTPINCIIGMLDMLNECQEFPSILKNVYLNPAIFSSYILLNIINDLLDMAEINRSGKIRMVFEQFSPITLCQECLSFIKLQAHSKGLQIDLLIDENVPHLIYTDINKTRQVLLNLLSNALKFTQKGTIVIKLSHPLDGILQIDVKDTGCGINPQKLKQIFQNFSSPEYDTFQSQSVLSGKKTQKQDFHSSSNSNGSSNRQYNNQNTTKNAGFGLSISYQLATCLGKNRKLSVKSEVGKGSVFTFFIANRSFQKKSCILYPKLMIESNASQLTRNWTEKDLALGHNLTLQTIKTSNQESEQIKTNQTFTLKSQSPRLGIVDQEEEILIRNPYQELTSHKSEKVIRTKNQIRNDRRKTTQDLIKRGKGEFHFNHLNNDHLLDQFFDESFIEEQQFEEISQNLQSFHKFQSQPKILKNHYGKTTQLLMKSVSTLLNLNIPFDEDYQGSCKNFKAFQSSQFLYSQHFGNEQNTKNAFSILDQQSHYQVQSSLNSVQTKSQNNQNSNPSFEDLEQIQDNSIHQNSSKIKQNKKRVQQMHKISSDLLQIGRRSNDSQESFFINLEPQESFNNKPQGKKRASRFFECKEKQIGVLTLNDKEYFDLYSDLMNESYNKQKPNQFNKLQVCKKPKPQEMDSQSDKSITTKKEQLNQININKLQIDEKQDVEIKKSRKYSNDDTNIRNQNSSLRILQQIDNDNMKNDQQHQKEISKKEIKNKFIDVKQLIIRLNRERNCTCQQIMIVDDNEFNVYALELRLKLYSFSADKVYSGYSAIQQIKDRINQNNCCPQYSLIFMDIDMPGKNGYQTTLEIIQMCQILHIAPPIISACSAYVQEDEKQKAFESGMSYYITKPVNQQAFENVLFQVFYQNI